MKITDYTERFYSRFAWKVGNLVAEDSYCQTPSLFSVAVRVNEEAYVFYDLESGSYPASHSFHVMFGNWGVWVAVRARKIIE